MNISLSLIISILFIVCIILISKLYLMKKSIREIEKSFAYILEADTNNLITISSSDADTGPCTSSGTARRCWRGPGPPPLAAGGRR